MINKNNHAVNVTGICGVEIRLTATKIVQIHHFLKALPHLEFSEKGLNNISKRFGISTDELKQIIDEVRRSI